MIGLDTDIRAIHTLAFSVWVIHSSFFAVHSECAFNATDHINALELGLKRAEGETNGTCETKPFNQTTQSVNNRECEKKLV